MLDVGRVSGTPPGLPGEGCDGLRSNGDPGGRGWMRTSVQDGTLRFRGPEGTRSRRETLQFRPLCPGVPPVCRDRSGPFFGVPPPPRPRRDGVTWVMEDSGSRVRGETETHCLTGFRPEVWVGHEPHPQRREDENDGRSHTGNRQPLLFDLRLTPRGSFVRVGLPLVPYDGSHRAPTLLWSCLAHSRPRPTGRDWRRGPKRETG